MRHVCVERLAFRLIPVFYHSSVLLLDSKSGLLLFLGVDVRIIGFLDLGIVGVLGLDVLILSEIELLLGLNLVLEGLQLGGLSFGFEGHGSSVLSLKLGNELISFLNGSNLVGVGLHDGSVGISNGLGVDGNGIIGFLGALFSLGEEILGSLISCIGLLFFFFGTIQDLLLGLNLSPLDPVLLNVMFTTSEINVVDSSSTVFGVEPSEMGVGSNQTFLEGGDTGVALLVAALGV
jgi:hypothetical protein